MFGRDGASAEQQPVVRRSRRWPGVIFSALVITAIAAALVVLTLPREKLDAWFSGEMPSTAQPNSQPAKPPAAKPQMSWPDIRFPAMEALGKPQEVFDPVARSRATAAIEKAFIADRAENNARLQREFDERLEALNKSLADWQAKAQGSERDTRIASLKNTANALNTSFSKRSDAVEKAVTTERDRRLRILRGL